MAIISGRLSSQLQVLYSNQDLQGNKGKLCDFLVFFSDIYGVSASAVENDYHH